MTLPVQAPGLAAEDPRYTLAFSEAQRALDHQSETLGNLRDRSAALLSTATLLSGFASGLGLINTDRDKGNVFPGWLALIVVALILAIGVCSLLVLVPSPGWVFTNNAAILLSNVEQNPDRDVNWVHAMLAQDMRRHEEANQIKLDRRFLYYRIGVGLLLAQTLALVCGVTFLR
jgi:hypothetical protein